MKDLILNDFESRVGTDFTAELDDGTSIGLKLTSATGVGSATASSTGDTGRPFSLLFRGPAEHLLTQGITPLSHPEMGRLDIFLVPIQPDAEGPLYEAIFT